MAIAERTCEQCGATFSGGRMSRVCPSKDCRRIYWNRRRNELNRSKKPAPITEEEVEALREKLKRMLMDLGIEGMKDYVK